ncbi:hypothetical protein ACFL04_01390 [Patescibacteria group bacterium]
MPANKKIDNSQQKGAVLLISLIIMSSLTAVGLGMSIVIIKEFRSASVVDHGIEATYASEEGLEWALDQLGEGRDSGSDLSDIINNTIITGNRTYTDTNFASWDSSRSSVGDDILVQDIAADKAVELDLFDPASSVDPFQPVGFGNISTIRIQADTTDGWAEVSWVAWDGAALSENSRTVFVSSSNISSGKIINLNDQEFINKLGFDPVDIKAYRIRIKARFSGLKNVEVTVFDDDIPAKQVPIPNRAKIISTGTSSNSTIALTTSIPWRLPVSSIFDFVLFSDESITK